MLFDLIFEPISEFVSWVGRQLLFGLLTAFNFIRSKLGKADALPRRGANRRARRAITAKRR
ncbi:hypothetical protein [uncultured Jatrophihabitans sp.]|uniref:hypothetical protein n=1 Tax=uncultured Jatrophihabitans sp. TaxID=1610747 RepID=UPI0035C968E0